MRLVLLEGPAFPYETTVKVDPFSLLTLWATKAFSYSMIRSTGDNVDDDDAELRLRKDSAIVSTGVSSAVSCLTADMKFDDRAVSVELEASPRLVPCKERSWACSS